MSVIRFPYTAYEEDNKHIFRLYDFTTEELPKYLGIDSLISLSMTSYII